MAMFSSYVKLPEGKSRVPHGSARDLAHMTVSTCIRGVGNINLDIILEIVRCFLTTVFHVSFFWGCDFMQENRVNQNRKGCNKHFKDAALGSGRV